MKSALGQAWRFLSGARDDSPNSKPPLFLAFRSSSNFILATVCLAIFTDIFLYGLIVPVLPYSLSVQAGVAEKDVQTWNAILLGIYNGALCLGSPIAGFYADHTSSRRWPLLLGLLALAGSTLLLCLGKTVALLVIGRLLQGLSAAIVWSVGLALLADTMGDKIGVSVGYVSISLSLGLFVSPLLGGAIYGGAGYYAVYYIAFAFIFLDIVLRLLMIEKKIARQWIQEDKNTNPASSPKPGDADCEAGMSHSEKGTLEIPQDQNSTLKPALTNEVGQERPSSPTTNPLPPIGESSPGPGQPEGVKKVHPHLTLLKSMRMLAALCGCVIIAGIM